MFIDLDVIINHFCFVLLFSWSLSPLESNTEDRAVGSIAIDVSVLLIIFIEVLLIIL